MVLKAQDEHVNCLEQIGAGRKAFGHLWNNIMVRGLFNLLLPFIMLLSDFYLPIKDIVNLLFHKKKYLFTNRLFVGHNRQLYHISKRACLQDTNDAWLKLPTDTYKLPENKNSYTIFDFITYGEIFKSAYQSFVIHCMTILKMGYDKYFLSYNGYSWCITDFALRHISVDVELVYSYICDRHAILIDRLNNIKKSMVQHGTMHFGTISNSNPYMEYYKSRGFYIWKSLYKSSPTIVYCYTDDDVWALSNSVIANNPKYVLIGYGFKPSFKPEKKSLLIIANYYFYSKQEEEIIKRLQDLDITIYLKNHPAISNNLYANMRKLYSFSFINGVDTNLPDVDIVVSYDSTLAKEYASIGTKVLYYGQFDLTSIKDIVTMELGLS